jgi:translation initiation factor IF-3
VKDEAPATAKKSSKEASSPKITLIDDQKIEIVSLEAAKKLSKRRDLKLVKVIDLDAKTQRAVYKLMYDFI